MTTPQLAFIGFNSDTADVAVHLIHESYPVHRIYCDQTDHVHPKWLSEVTALEQWQELLNCPEETVIFVSLSQADPEIQDMLRKLTAQGGTVAVIAPDADYLFAYELEMIRVESGGVLVPVNHTPQGIQVIQNDPNLITVTAGIIVADLEHVIRRLTYDLLQLKPLIGQVKFLFAMSLQNPGGRDEFSVTVETDSSKILQWATAPNENNASIYSLTKEDQTTSAGTFEHTDIIQLVASASNRCQNLSNRRWLEYATAREAAEMIPLSLKKGKKIELFNAPPTESDAFKGVMSGLGCFLLLLTLAIIGLFAAFDIIRLSDLRDSHQTALASETTSSGSPLPLFIRLWPVYPLLLFLGFQFLRRIIKKTVSQPTDNGKLGKL